MGDFRAEFALSILSCALMFAVSTYGGTIFAGPGYLLLSILNRLVAFLAVAWLVSFLFRRHMVESTLRSCEECLGYHHASPAGEEVRRDLLFVGRLSVEKGVATLAGAMRALPDAGRRVAGDGPEAGLLDGVAGG